MKISRNGIRKNNKNEDMCLTVTDGSFMDIDKLKGKE